MIDLNCLDLMDAKAITKQKIYDVALVMREQGGLNSSKLKHVGPFSNQSQSYDQSNEPTVLIIQCSDEHYQQAQNESMGGGARPAPPQNGIVDAVKNELKLDHFYITQKKIILVKIDSSTLDNTVLNDW